MAGAPVAVTHPLGRSVIWPVTYVHTVIDDRSHVAHAEIHGVGKGVTAASARERVSNGCGQYN